MSIRDIFKGADGVHTETVWREDGIEFRNHQDIGNMVEEFRRESENVNRRAAGRLAARIPLVVYNDWKNEWRTKHSDKWDWQTFLAMRVNSYDYSYLRNQKL